MNLNKYGNNRQLQEVEFSDGTIVNRTDDNSNQLMVDDKIKISISALVII